LTWIVWLAMRLPSIAPPENFPRSIPEGDQAQISHSYHTVSPSSSTQITLFAFRRRERLHKFEIGFGVEEFFDLLDLQAPVFVRDDVHDGYRFVDHINPERGLHLIGQVRDDLSRSVYGRMGGLLRVGPKGKNLAKLPKPLLARLLWLVKRSWVGDLTKVLVQALRENACVSFSNPWLHSCTSLTCGESELDIGMKRLT